MRPWSDRPSEIANLLNPAFCGLLLFESVDGYVSIHPAGMPLTIAALVFPVILHEATRARLPRSTATSLHAWLQQNPDLRIRFAHRTRELLPYTRESILFLAGRGALQLTEGFTLRAEGRLSRGREAMSRKSVGIKDCIQKAKLVGKWFALAGDPATVYQMWGVCP